MCLKKCVSAYSDMPEKNRAGGRVVCFMPFVVADPPQKLDRLNSFGKLHLYLLSL